MRRFGVSNTTRVITYSTANAWWATRVWWLLREFGHDKRRGAQWRLAEMGA